MVTSVSSVWIFVSFTLFDTIDSIFFNFSLRMRKYPGKNGSRKEDAFVVNIDNKADEGEGSVRL